MDSLKLIVFENCKEFGQKVDESLKNLKKFVSSEKKYLNKL